jgi:hypothetical protein
MDEQQPQQHIEYEWVVCEVSAAVSSTKREKDNNKWRTYWNGIMK